jgi:glycerol-3-phosphate acyltransferase PlsY
MLILIVRLVQRGYLDIAYCWLWLVVGLGICGIVLKYEWLVQLSDLIGSKTPTTTLFLLAFVILLLLCLQFSMVISTHRRQIKRLTQQLAILEERATLPEDRAPRQLDTGS